MANYLGTKLVGIKKLFCDIAKEKNIQNEKTEKTENVENKKNIDMNFVSENINEFLVADSNFVFKEGNYSFKKHEDKLHKACCGASISVIKCALINVLIRFPKINFINLMKIIDQITMMYQFLPDLRKFLNDNGLPYFQCVKSINKIKKNQALFKSYVLEGENSFNSQFTNKTPSVWNSEDFYQFSKLSLFLANIRMNISLIAHKTLRKVFSQNIIMDYNEKNLLDLAQNLKISFIQIWTIVNDINVLYSIKMSAFQSNIIDTNTNNNKTLYGTNSISSETSYDDVNSSSEDSDDLKSIILEDVEKKQISKIKIGGKAIDDLTVVTLKSELKKRNLKPCPRARKADLIEQLKNAIISEYNTK